MPINQTPSPRRLLAAAALALLASGAHAQEQAAAQQPEQTLPNWRVICNNNADAGVLGCSMSQTVFVENTNQRIVAMELILGDDGPVAVFALPHGLDLQAGVTILFDEEEEGQNFPINTADQNGALAQVSVSDELLESMRNGLLMTVQVANTSGQRLNLQMSLVGFSRSYDLLGKHS